MTRTRVCLLLLVLFIPFHSIGFAQELKAPPRLAPDERFKADILVIVAHPDDETMITGYLARAIYDQHKRVAVIYGTRGDGGGNTVGEEQAAALGAVREIEARRATTYQSSKWPVSPRRASLDATPTPTLAASRV